MKHGKPSRRPGVALISALMVMVILVIIASAFVQLTARDVRSSQTSGDTLMTLYLAEAGIEYAIWAIKHNMNVYPVASYDVDPTDASTTPKGRGEVISLFANSGGTGFDNTQEHVLINDLAYAGDNWLGRVQYCGTFQVTHTFTTTGTGVNERTRVDITSEGRVRQVPANWNWNSPTLTADLRTAFATGPNGTFKVRSKRTLHTSFEFDGNTLANIGSTVPNDSQSVEAREDKWWELFR